MRSLGAGNPRGVVALGAIGAVSLLFAGCSGRSAEQAKAAFSSAPTMTEREKNNFRGGPMPPEAQKKMVEEMASHHMPASAPINATVAGSTSGK